MIKLIAGPLHSDKGFTKIMLFSFEKGNDLIVLPQPMSSISWYFIAAVTSGQEIPELCLRLSC